MNIFHELTAHSVGQEIPNCVDKISLRQGVWLSEEQHADSAEFSLECKIGKCLEFVCINGVKKKKNKPSEMRREWKLVSNNFAQNSFFMTQNRKSH